MGGERPGIEQQCLALARVAHTELAKQSQHGANVLQHRHPRELKRVGSKERGAQNRQRCVLRARHLNLACQRATAGDSQFVHRGL